VIYQAMLFCLLPLNKRMQKLTQNEQQILTQQHTTVLLVVSYCLVDRNIISMRQTEGDAPVIYQAVLCCLLPLNKRMQKLTQNEQQIILTHHQQHFCLVDRNRTSMSQTAPVIYQAVLFCLLCLNTFLKLLLLQLFYIVWLTGMNILISTRHAMP
jgi:hypothetical protein